MLWATGVHIFEFRGKTRLHPRRRHLQIALLFLEMWTLWEETNKQSLVGNAGVAVTVPVATATYVISSTVTSDDLED